MKSTYIPQNIIDAMDPDVRKELNLMTSDERIEKADKCAEKEIQSVVEGYCVQIGFERLTEDNIKTAGIRPGFPSSGFQYHLSPFGAKKNKMLPDLTLFDRTGRYLWLELKKKDGKPSPLQAVLIDAGLWRVAYSATDAIEIIKEWFGCMRR